MNERLIERRKHDKKLYYERLKLPPHAYTESDDKLILEHNIPDRELSKIINAGVRAIQVRRSALKSRLKMK